MTTIYLMLLLMRVIKKAGAGFLLSLMVDFTILSAYGFFMLFLV